MHESVPAATRPSSPEALAIEHALPRLEETLRPAFERLWAAIVEPAEAPAPGTHAAPESTAAEPSAAATGTHAAPELAAAEPSAAATEPRVEPRAAAEPAEAPEAPESTALRTALAAWFSHRVAAALALALPDRDERARYAGSLALRLEPRGTEPPGEDLARQRVLAAVRDPFARDTLAGRVDVAATLAVRHVLLGGPSPDEQDRTPRPEEAAGMGRRLVAYALDLSLATVASFAAGMVLGWVGGAAAEFDSTLLGYLVVAAGGLVNVQLLASTGTTLGKLTMGIGVVRAADGSAPDLELAFRREFIGRFLNQLLFGVGYLVGWFRKFHRTWGDEWAGTVVIRLRQPVPWRRWAALATFTTSAFCVSYLPAALHLEELDQATAARIEAEGESLITLTDSLVDLVTRPVPSGADMERDLRDILALAPSVSARALAVTEETGRYRRMVRRIAPWNAGMAARLDSMYIMVASCARSAEDFALHMQVSTADAADSSVASRFRAASQYAASDVIADRAYLRSLGIRLNEELGTDAK
jgi:uncharacterized RDD family membrane protein YckC